MLIRIIFALIFLQLSPSALASDDLRLISVSDYPFTLNNKPAVSISFGESEAKACSLTIEKENIYQGYVGKSFRNNNQSIDVECMWDGVNLVRSSKHKTGLKFKIGSLDKKDQIATVSIKLQLIAPSTNETIFLDKVLLSIDGIHFKNLISK